MPMTVDGPGRLPAQPPAPVPTRTAATPGPRSSARVPTMDGGVVGILKDQWTDWAREWGLAHYPEKGWMRRTERVVGQHRGLLVQVGWGTDQNPGLITLIRFPRAMDVTRLRDSLIDDASLDVLPGKGSARRKMKVETGTAKQVYVGGTPEFILRDSCLVWRRTFAFWVPKGAEVKAWVDALITAIGR